MRADTLRLTDDELLALLNDLESERCERKENYSGEVRKRAREAICAFANDLSASSQPGVLFIGVDDQGEPSGLAITDELLQALGDMRSDGNILPLPVLTVEKRHLKGQAVAVVTVAPSDMPPVKYDGRIWIRVGPRRAVAHTQEERILNEKRRSKDLPFDLRPIPSASLGDLSRATFEDEYLPRAVAREVLAENGRSYEEQLASCRMTVAPDDPTPTVLGLLALGKNPQASLPGAYIQFLRIDGTELADPVLDESRIAGNLVKQLERAETVLEAHNRRRVDIVSGPTHKIDEAYPPAAFQQALYNAVLHRAYEGTHAPVRVYWYNDRVEFNSPGGPYGNVTTENFGKPGITDYRNPNIADVLKTFGFVQSFGRGIATIRNAMAANGNPPPEFQLSSSGVVVVLRNKG